MIFKIYTKVIKNYLEHGANYSKTYYNNNNDITFCNSSTMN